ncbi:hypothetical protein [Salinibaculum salinum]|uniref:hypothetical protein n=1 Tax=Salinibaculum salinum TaxID=3131996 RepID=UPI0030EB99B7
MVSLPLDQIPVRGMVIGLVVLLSGTVTATITEDNGLAALVAAVVLLIFLLLDERYSGDEE